MPSPPRFAPVNGIKIAYDDVGEGDRPFVLVHGFTGHRRDFDTQLPALAKEGRTLVPDLRGHGDSTNASEPSRYGFPQLVDDLRAFLDALDVGRCDLLGHSVGGMVVLRFALAHPERIHSLVLMNTAARVPDGIPRKAFELAARVAQEAGMVRLQQLVQERIAEDPMRSPADARLQREWGDERYWARHRARFHAMDPEAYVGLGRALLDQKPVVDRLGQIAHPTLVMVGELDAPFLAAADELERGIPGAVRVTIAEAGHQPQLETPEAWIDAIRRHLARMRATGWRRAPRARGRR